MPKYKPSPFEAEPEPETGQFKPSPFGAEPASEGPVFNAAKLNKKEIQSRPGIGLTGTIEDREATGGLRGLITGEAPARDVSMAESAGRGVAQGSTFGFADELGAAVTRAGAETPGFSKFMQTLTGLPSGVTDVLADKNISYTQRRDLLRNADAEAQAANPKTFLANELIGSAIVPVPGGAAVKGSTTLAKAASLAKTGAKVGALTGLGSSNADLTRGEFDKAIDDTVKGAAIGAVAAPVAAAALKVAGKVAGKAGQAFKTKAVKDSVDAVSQGAGLSGSNTMTSAKRLAQDPKGLEAALSESFTAGGKKVRLGEIMRQDAEKIMPIVEERLDQVGSKFDPILDKFNKANGGGMASADFNKFIDTAVAKLETRPLQEKWVNALRDVQESANKAWKGGPIPYSEFRAMVTQLQKRGTKTLDTLHPGESSEVKADIAQALREWLVDDLTRVAGRFKAAPGSKALAVPGTTDLTKDAEALFKGWRTYSNTAKIRDAVEERIWKERGGRTSGKGHIATAVGGMVGSGIGAGIGGPIGAAIGAPIGAAAGKVTARKLGDLSAKATRSLGNIYSASQGKRGQAVLDAIKAGVPRAVAMDAARRANAGLSQDEQ